MYDSIARALSPRFGAAWFLFASMSAACVSSQDHGNRADGGVTADASREDAHVASDARTTDAPSDVPRDAFVAADAPRIDARCGNDELDEGETDIDCGGVCEAGCEATRACERGADCASGACISDVCREHGFERVADLPIARRAAALALGDDGRVFVFGGAASSGALDSVNIFNPTLGAWSTGAPMPTARAGVSAATAIDGRIAVVGGALAREDAFLYRAVGDAATVEIYDPAEDSWSSGPSLVEGHGSGGAARWEDRVLVFGGVGAGEIEEGGGFGAPSPNVLALEDDAWTVATGRLSHDQTTFATATIPGVGIAVVGGWRVSFADYGLLDTLELYDGSAWYVRAPMPETRDAPSAAASNGILYVFGGLTNDGPTRVVENVLAYVPSENEWYDFPEMPAPRSGGNAITLADGRIMIVGGVLDDADHTHTNEVWLYTP